MFHVFRCVVNNDLHRLETMSDDIRIIDRFRDIAVQMNLPIVTHESGEMSIGFDIICEAGDVAQEMESRAMVICSEEGLSAKRSHVQCEFVSDRNQVYREG